MTQVFALNGAGQALEVARFWGEIAARWESETPSLASYPEWMQRAIQTFENEDGLRSGFTHLLEKSHVSPGHLAREWKRVFGQTPTHWINERRLQVAAQLLLQTSLSVKEIAARCGFDNIHYFYRVFSHRFGIAPKTYRMKRDARAGAAQSGD
jgi:AraC-like DNA-binding protein